MKGERRMAEGGKAEEGNEKGEMRLNFTTKKKE